MTVTPGHDNDGATNPLPHPLPRPSADYERKITRFRGHRYAQITQFGGRCDLAEVTWQSTSL